MKKWNVYAAAVLAAVGILGGCGAKNAESQAPAETQAAEQSAQESSVERSQKQRQRKMEPCLLPM